MGLKKFCAVFILAYVCHAVESASILALFSTLSYTDHLVYRGYVSLLAKKGHSVVVMTPYPGHFHYPEAENIIELDVGEDSAQHWEEYKKLMTNTDDYHPRLKAMNEFSLKLAIVQLKSKQMTAVFINPNIHFDLVITEADVPLLYAVAEKYKAPHIAITTSSGKIHQHEAKGNPIHPIWFLDVNTLSYRNSTYWEKVIEFNRHIQTKNEYYNNYLPLCELAAKKILGLERSLQEVENDIDLLFIAYNPVLSGSRPSVPAVIYTDRMHIKPGLKLPKDLNTVLDSSTKGVVYFSLGAIQEAEQLPASMLYILSESFRELPFTVLWKIGNTTMFDIPDNVITQTWFPQQQVLAHPNVKAFITHGGPRSLEEAVFYKVPIIGFPVLKSRKVFIKEITAQGAGELLDPYKLDKETIKDTIAAVTNNEKYQKAMAILRTTVIDPIISGPENALWWTEYVLRHGEARHLHSPAVGLSMFKYYMLDTLCYLLLTVFAIFLLAILMIYCIILRMRQRFSGSRVVDESSKFKAL